MRQISISSTLLGNVKPTKEGQRIQQIVKNISSKQVVLAAQKAFLFSSEGTTNEPFFRRLLSPVIGQLSAELPEEMAQREISTAKSNAPDDAMGAAVVSALVQMGIRSGEEAFLKPLHHQVSDALPSFDIFYLSFGKGV